MNLTEKQKLRYNRHIMLDNIDIEGQKKLLNSKVLIIGVGGLGSPIILYLAAAGVGTLGLIDDDLVELSNLQRQIVHFTSDLKKLKVNSAAEKIKDVNPDVKVNIYKKRINENNIYDIFKDYDFIIDATDNFPAKFLINDACVKLKKAYSHGGVLKFDGQTMTYVPGNTCYRCIFQEPPTEEIARTCSFAGVLGVIPGILGTIQATECLKYLLGIGDLLINELLIFDSLKMNFRKVHFKKSKKCTVCEN